VTGLTDLFGEVPVSHHDIYAWLLIIAEIDPVSIRAEAYARTYNVLEKIIRAKYDSSFDEILECAEDNLRYRELVASAPFATSEMNQLGLKHPDRAKYFGPMPHTDELPRSLKKPQSSRRWAQEQEVNPVFRASTRTRSTYGSRVPK
jgi:hypothetical protein